MISEDYDQRQWNITCLQISSAIHNFESVHCCSILSSVMSMMDMVWIEMDLLVLCQVLVIMSWNKIGYNKEQPSVPMAYPVCRMVPNSVKSLHKESGTGDKIKL